MAGLVALNTLTGKLEIGTFLPMSVPTIVHGMQWPLAKRAGLRDHSAPESQHEGAQFWRIEVLH
jgi:hypothetical protein